MIRTGSRSTQIEESRVERAGVPLFDEQLVDHVFDRRIRSEPTDIRSAESGNVDPPIEAAGTRSEITGQQIDACLVVETLERGTEGGLDGRATDLPTGYGEYRSTGLDPRALFPDQRNRSE